MSRQASEYIDSVHFQVWFQNRRAKWKKRKKTTNVFNTPGALLSPFTSMTMGNSFCSPFTPDSRWPTMPPHNLSLPPALPRQSMTPPMSMTSLQSSPSQLQVPGAGAMGLNHSMGAAGASMYSPSYAMMTSCDSPLASSMMTSSPVTSASMLGCQMSEHSDAWSRGSSLASLRQKAIEHSATLTFR